MSTKKDGAKGVNNFQELVGRIKGSERYDQEVLRSEISDQISALLLTQGVNKAEFARRLKTSKSYVTKILQGNANFTLDTLVQISRVLGCKYETRFVPVDAWKKVEAIQFSAVTKGAAPTKTYEVRTSVGSKTEIR